jgi:CheY-like chemotaxis protein
MRLGGMARGSRGKGRAVLVVDDDPDVRETLAELVSRSGRAVFTAGDGSEALSLLDAATVPRPCLVLLDLMMAPMDGRAFLEHVRARDDVEQFPVLVVSANPQTPTKPAPRRARDATKAIRGGGAPGSSRRALPEPA